MACKNCAYFEVFDRPAVADSGETFFNMCCLLDVWNITEYDQDLDCEYWESGVPEPAPEIEELKSNGGCIIV